MPLIPWFKETKSLATSSCKSQQNFVLEKVFLPHLALVLSYSSECGVAPCIEFVLHPLFILIHLAPVVCNIGVERFGHAGRPCSQHLASLLNLLFDKGLFKWGMCVLQCPPSSLGALWARGGPYFAPSVRISVKKWSSHMCKSSSPSTVPIPSSSPLQLSGFQMSFPSSSSFWKQSPWSGWPQHCPFLQQCEFICLIRLLFSLSHSPNCIFPLPHQHPLGGLCWKEMP